MIVLRMRAAVKCSGSCELGKMSPGHTAVKGLERGCRGGDIQGYRVLQNFPGNRLLHYKSKEIGFVAQFGGIQSPTRYPSKLQYVRINYAVEIIIANVSLRSCLNLVGVDILNNYNGVR